MSDQPRPPLRTLSVRELANILHFAATGPVRFEDDQGRALKVQAVRNAVVGQLTIVLTYPSDPDQGGRT